MTFTPLTPKVMEAFSRVMEEVREIGKKDRNRDQNFMFRGIDTVINTVGPLLRKHGVVIIPTAESIETERYVTNKGTAMKNATVRMRYTVHGPAGDSFEGVTYGEAADSGDKAVSKAQSVAYRVFLLQSLTIPTNEPDPDASSHERSSVHPAQAAREELLAVLKRKGVQPDDAMQRFAADNDGMDIRACNDPSPIHALTAHYSALPEAVGEQ
ncbi:ERF family protein [Nocardia wallacei]|nr:ERF family protein [Nocardia wallacei]